MKYLRNLLEPEAGHSGNDRISSEFIYFSHSSVAFTEKNYLAGVIVKSIESDTEESSFKFRALIEELVFVGISRYPLNGHKSSINEAKRYSEAIIEDVNLAIVPAMIKTQAV